MTKQGFKLNLAANPSAKESYKDSHYVTADPSDPPLLFKFRSDDKETFLQGPFKVNFSRK